ncbi:DUF2461 domain-containing protein [Bacteroidota bacterium]
MINTKFILNFLTGLSKNNTREWMEENKKDYQLVKSEFQNLVGLFISEISAFDNSIEGVDVKKCIFRLNRDIRFSKDKRPYKENLGAFIAQDGRHSQRGGYYLHLQPGNKSMLAGGIYMPQSDVLKKIRQEIDYSPNNLKEIINNDRFKKLFSTLEGEKLKTAPKGFRPDHPDIELLKYKSYIVVHNLDDTLIKSADFISYSTEVFREMKPLNDFLATAVS